MINGDHLYLRFAWWRGHGKTETTVIRFSYLRFLHGGVSENTHMSLSCPTLICQDEVRHNKCSLLEATGCGQRQCGHARHGPWRERRRRQRRGSITLASSLRRRERRRRPPPSWPPPWLAWPSAACRHPPPYDAGGSCRRASGRERRGGALKRLQPQRMPFLWSTPGLRSAAVAAICAAGGYVAMLAPAVLPMLLLQR